MKKETGDTQDTNPAASRAADTAFYLYDIPSQVLQLKREGSWSKSGRGAKTLYKADSLRIVLNVMKAGTEIKTHQAAGPISVQVVEGRMQFVTEQESVVLQRGEMLVLKEFVRHSVEALEETAFLLTVAPLQV